MIRTYNNCWFQLFDFGKELQEILIVFENGFSLIDNRDFSRRSRGKHLFRDNVLPFCGHNFRLRNDLNFGRELNSRKFLELSFEFAKVFLELQVKLRLFLCGLLKSGCLFLVYFINMLQHLACNGVLMLAFSPIQENLQLLLLLTNIVELFKQISSSLWLSFVLALSAVKVLHGWLDRLEELFNLVWCILFCLLHCGGLSFSNGLCRRYHKAEFRGNLAEVAVPHQSMNGLQDLTILSADIILELKV